MSLDAIFCDNKYQKFLTQVFFLIHISTCFCCFPFNILGKEFMSKKREFQKTWKDFWWCGCGSTGLASVARMRCYIQPLSYTIIGGVARLKSCRQKHGWFRPLLTPNPRHLSQIHATCPKSPSELPLANCSPVLQTTFRPPGFW